MIAREAKAVAKSAKMLVHYIHHFGNIHNILFNIYVIDPQGYGPQYGYQNKDKEEKDNFEVYLEIKPAFGSKAVFTKLQDGSTSRKFETIPSDILKLCTYVELCPDMIVVDKETNYKNTGATRYRIQSINHDLPFIRVDFFK